MSDQSIKHGEKGAMQNGLWLLIVILLFILPAQAQPDDGFERDTLFASYGAFSDSLEAVVSSGEATALDAFWQVLKDANQVPFAHGDSVAFLYRGAASQVAWNGDFNAWGGAQGVASAGRRLGGSDVWILEHTFPADARIDYKIVLNGTEWILDPNNPLEQWSGFGPNSELRMPDYSVPQEAVRRPGVPRGRITSPVRFRSARLGYDVHYRVYTPAGYDTLSGLPTVYVTDGHEYADDRLGSMPLVLDNIIADGLILPVLAVFVDPRQPGDAGVNRRQSQYADDPEPFAAFLADELVPAIDSTYRTDPLPERRAILGTSLGGLFSAYLGAARPDAFRRIAIHSPAFSYDTARNQDRVFRMYTEADRLPLTIFMSTGTLFDTQPGALRMKALLEEKGYPLHYLEVNEGHSWGNWRALIDDPLRFFWSAEVNVGIGEAVEPVDRFDLTSYPNPFREQTTIAFRLPLAQRVSLDVYNLLGRRVHLLLDEAPLAAGPHAVTMTAPPWPSGLYLYRLTGEVFTAMGQMLLVR